MRPLIFLVLRGCACAFQKVKKGTHGDVRRNHATAVREALRAPEGDIQRGQGRGEERDRTLNGLCRKGL